MRWLLPQSLVFLYHISHGMHLSCFELQHFEKAFYGSFFTGHEIVFDINMFSVMSFGIHVAFAYAIELCLTAFKM